MFQKLAHLKRTFWKKLWCNSVLIKLWPCNVQPATLPNTEFTLDLSGEVLKILMHSKKNLGGSFFSVAGLESIPKILLKTDPTAQIFRHGLGKKSLFKSSVIHQVRAQNFPKNQHFYPPDTHMLVFRKILCTYLMDDP